MKMATRSLLEEQIAVVVVLGSGKKDGAMWHVPHSGPVDVFSTLDICSGPVEVFSTLDMQ